LIEKDIPNGAVPVKNAPSFARPDPNSNPKIATVRTEWSRLKWRGSLQRPNWGVKVLAAGCPCRRKNLESRTIIRNLDRGQSGCLSPTPSRGNTDCYNPGRWAALFQNLHVAELVMAKPP